MLAEELNSREREREYQRQYRLRNKDRNKIYYAANKERVAARNKVWRAANAEKLREKEKARHAKRWTPEAKQQAADATLFRKYGITRSEWNEMFEAQGFACAICRTDKPGVKDWHTDHCHESGRIRGILCNGCNTGMGLFKDRSTLLEKAADYLRASQW